MRRLFLMAAALLSALAGQAAAAGDARGPAYAIERTEVRQMVSASGSAYRIMVGWPDSPPPPEGFPVLYVLDGDDNFAVAVETARRLALFGARSGVMPGIVVGIGYVQDGRRQRAFDFTPALEGGVDPMGNPVGGADAFLDFLENDLKPAVAEAYPINPVRQSLFGHSYGGLFVLHALYTRPHSFNTYIATSPSLWFGQGVILKEEAAFRERQAASPLPLTLLLGVGALEQAEQSPAAAAPHRGPGRMVDDNRALADRLRGLDGLTIDQQVFTGMTHGTSALPAIGHALPYAFAASSH